MFINNIVFGVVSKHWKWSWCVFLNGKHEISWMRLWINKEISTFQLCCSCKKMENVFGPFF